jgi:hypothetical protein
MTKVTLQLAPGACRRVHDGPSCLFIAVRWEGTGHGRSTTRTVGRSGHRLGARRACLRGIPLRGRQAHARARGALRRRRQLPGVPPRHSRAQVRVRRGRALHRRVRSGGLDHAHPAWRRAGWPGELPPARCRWLHDADLPGLPLPGTGRLGSLPRPAAGDLPGRGRAPRSSGRRATRDRRNGPAIPEPRDWAARPRTLFHDLGPAAGDRAVSRAPPVAARQRRPAGRARHLRGSSLTHADGARGRGDGPFCARRLLP